MLEQVTTTAQYVFRPLGAKHSNGHKPNYLIVEFLLRSFRYCASHSSGRLAARAPGKEKI